MVLVVLLMVVVGSAAQSAEPAADLLSKLCTEQQDDVFLSTSSVRP